MENPCKISYLRTKDGAEIVLIIEKLGAAPLCIKIKSGRTVDDLQVERLNNSSSAVRNSNPIMIDDGAYEQLVKGVRVPPLGSGVKGDLW